MHLTIGSFLEQLSLIRVYMICFSIIYFYIFNLPVYRSTATTTTSSSSSSSSSSSMTTITTTTSAFDENVIIRQNYVR
jgi:capsule polysaccharide export protein KpsE/RkpR